MEEKVETDLVNEEIIESPMDLLHKLAIAEENYLKEESIYKNEFNELMLNADWDTINSERKEQGLSKLSNQDMKKSYVEKALYIYKSDLILAKLEYNRLLRMYEMMKKYSLDILR